MKTRNILHAFLTCAFFLGVLSMNAQTKIYVHKSNGMADEYSLADIDSISFTPPAALVDYTKLKLNEISGVGGDSEKFYELINIGDVDIPLAGCKIYYNNDPFNEAYAAPVTWTGCASQVIGAGELLTLIGRNNPCSFTTGLTAQRNIKVTMQDPAGNLIDEFIRSQDSGEYAIADKSFSRIPDGVGLFYFTDPTPDVMNGTDATDLLLLPGQEAPVVDYTKLKLNEVSGVGADGEKFYELINTGDGDIPLEGCKIYYNNDPFNEAYAAPVTWTGCADQVIGAGELLTLIGRNNPCSFTTGLTAQRNIRIILQDPDGNLIDEFIRAQDSGEYAISDKSFSRIPDGTGPFYFTTPTPDVMNGTDTTDMLEVPATQ